MLYCKFATSDKFSVNLLEINQIPNCAKKKLSSLLLDFDLLFYSYECFFIVIVMQMQYHFIDT